MKNFNSNKKSLEFFKQTPIHDWSFRGYDSYSEANNDRLARKSAIRARYKACLNDLSLMKDMKEEGRQKVLELLAENETEGSNPPARQTIFNNYGTVGVQGVISGGTVSIQIRKRAAADTSEGRTKKKGHLGKSSFISNQYSQLNSFTFFLGH
ncbi:hypothetical protein BDB01DRAFT_782223 [Pilobolus umbonatus]|nr:hypothetical protein BDB01DRAFT_782223 [Pilobolus umbonatus]